MPAVRYIIPLVLFLAAFAGCKTERENRIAKSTGKTAEILVVMENPFWDGRPGEVVRSAFQQENEGLPQPEALFSVLRINRNALDEIYRRHHNILVVSINPKYTETRVLTKDDYWASPQRVISIEASDEATFEAAFSERLASIIELMREAERSRLAEIFKTLHEQRLSNEINDLLKVRLTIPSGFFMAKKGEGVVWIRKETKDFSQGLLIYVEPYSDTSQFDPARIISRRNEVCNKYVPGPREGSYMTTSEVILPVSRKMLFKDKFAVETRGLWDVKGDFMGGPFLNYAIHDEKNNRIIHIDGYTYYPNKDKRDLMLQLETVIYTLQFE